MRASRATAPDGVTSSGLISSSAISGWAAANRLSCGHHAGGRLDVHGRPAPVLAEQCGGSQPAQHPRGLAPRRRGRGPPGRRARTSVAVPPMPTSTVGPKRGSHVLRRSARHRAAGRPSPRRRRPAGQAARRAGRARRPALGGPRRPTTTPPASDLCSRPSALSTYGAPQGIRRGRQLLARRDLARRARTARRPRRTQRVRGVVGRGDRLAAGHRLDRCDVRAVEPAVPRHRAAAASSIAANTGTPPSARTRHAGASGKIDCTATGLRPAGVGRDLLGGSALVGAEAGEPVLATGVAAEVAGHQDRVDVVRGLERRRRRGRSCAGPSRRRPPGRPGCATLDCAPQCVGERLLGRSRRAAAPRGPRPRATSHAMTPWPPPSVSTATRGPRGTACCRSASSTSASSRGVWTWIAPADAAGRAR